MKYLLIFSVLIIAAGLILRKDFFSINIYDTYYLINYLFLSIIIVIISNFLYFLFFALKK